MKKVILSVVALILGLWLIDYCYKIFIPHNSDLKYAHISNGGLDNDYLILGSSNSLHSIDISELNARSELKGYNLSLNGGSFLDAYFHLKQYLKQNQKPSKVFVCFVPEDLFVYPYKFHEENYLAFTHDEELNGYLKNKSIPFLRFSSSSRLSLYQAVKGAKHYLGQKQTPQFPSGTLPVPKPENGFKMYESFKNDNPYGKKIDLEQIRFENLEKVLFLGKKNEIEVIVFEPPILGEAHSYFLEYDDCLKKLNALCCKYNSSFYSFRNSVIKNDRNNFYSAFHLNKRGKNLFTKEFERLLHKKSGND